MREIRITVTDAEFRKLEKAKKTISWHSFIMKLSKGYSEKRDLRK